MSKHSAQRLNRKTYRKVPTRLRRKRPWAAKSPHELGVNTYRTHWLGMIGLGALTVAHFIEALPVLRQQQMFFAPWYSLLLWLLLVCAVLQIGFGSRHLVRPWVNILMALVVCVGVAVLPLAWQGGVLLQYPWIGGFIVLAVSTVSMAWNVYAAVLYMICVEAAYWVILSHLIPVDAHAKPLLTETIARIAFSLILVLAITFSKRATEKVDENFTEAIAQTLALTRSRSATAEQEHMDRLIHDNVMAALLDASRQEGPLARRTRELAGRALAVLEYEKDRYSGRSTTMLHDLLDQLMESLTPWRSRVRFSNLRPQLRPEGEPRVFVPTFVAQGLVQAVTEAVSNSARHSGSDVTYVSMDGAPCPDTPLNNGGFYLRFMVHDDGRGFAMHDVDTHRLGVRVSIMENVDSIGGIARVRSAPGRGTKVTIIWPKDAPQ